MWESDDFGYLIPEVEFSASLPGRDDTLLSPMRPYFPTGSPDDKRFKDQYDEAENRGSGLSALLVHALADHKGRDAAATSGLITELKPLVAKPLEITEDQATRVRKLLGEMAHCSQPACSSLVNETEEPEDDWLAERGVEELGDELTVTAAKHCLTSVFCDILSEGLLCHSEWKTEKLASLLTKEEPYIDLDLAKKALTGDLVRIFARHTQPDAINPNWTLTSVHLAPPSNEPASEEEGAEKQSREEGGSQKESSECGNTDKHQA